MPSVIQGAPSTVSVDADVLIAIARDPDGFEEKLKVYRETKALSDASATKAQEAEEKARQEQAKAAAMIDDANAIMAGARKGQADLETEKQAVAASKRDFAQIVQTTRQELNRRSKEAEEREKAVERREVAVRAREEKLTKDETEVQALKAEYEAKLGNLKKLVA